MSSNKKELGYRWRERAFLSPFYFLISAFPIFKSATVNCVLLDDRLLKHNYGACLRFLESAKPKTVEAFRN